MSVHEVEYAEISILLDNHFSSNIAEINNKVIRSKPNDESEEKPTRAWIF